MKKLLPLLLVVILLLASCKAENLPVEPTPSPPAEPVTVRYGMAGAWDALMPYNSPSASNYGRIVFDKIYDRLAYVHADGTLSPRGADSWEGADDGYGALFHLSEKAAFHDGTPVEARHWADTITLLTNPDCPTLGRAAFAVLAGTDDTGAAVAGENLGVEAVDTHTLKLTFKHPTTPEEFLLGGNREYYVLPTHLLEGIQPADLMTLPLWGNPIGSGPFKFLSDVAGSQLLLETNQNYQLGAPNFDRLSITVLDKANLLPSLIAGDLDYYAFGGNVSVEDAEVARQAGLTVLEGTVPNTFYELMLNNETIGSASLRRAIDLALDKEALCLQSTQGLGQVASSDLTPGSEYASPFQWARGVEGAKALLAQGGYGGESWTLACTANRAGLAALMQQNLAEVGLRVEIETVDSAALFSGMADGSYDMAIASHTPGSLPLWFTESRFTPDNNLFHVADLSPYTQYLEEIKAAPDSAVKQALVERFQELLWDERPFIPLWFGTTLHVQSPTVDGIDYPSSSFSNENVWDWVVK